MPQRLLGFLVLGRGKTQKREVVAETLWPERSPESARRCLNSTSHRLNQAVGNAENTGPIVVSPSSEDIALNNETLTEIDLYRFEELVETTIGHDLADPADTIALLRNAYDLHAGVLMDGFFDDWAMRERRRLESVFMEVLLNLATWHWRVSDFGAAICYGREIVEIDPLREDAHRDLMRALNANGERARALRQFDRLRDILATELAVPPMLETRQLYRAIRDGELMSTRSSDEAPKEKLTRRDLTKTDWSSQMDFRENVLAMQKRLRELHLASSRVISEVDEMESMISHVIDSMIDPQSRD